MSEWANDLKNTLPAIKLLKLKVFKNKVEIQSTEYKDEIIFKWLDQLSGIDYIAKRQDNQLITIACRIQWDINYKTFTIRFKRITGTKTEFDKRIDAIENGYLYPTFTMQAYLTENPLKLLDCALIKTDILYRFIKRNLNNKNLIFENTANKEGNVFKYVKWESLINLPGFWQYGLKRKKLINPKQLIINFDG